MNEQQKLGTLIKTAFGVSQDFSLSEEQRASITTCAASVKPYFIAFTARSGSTFLTHEAKSTNLLSYPHEWFNWDYIGRSGFRGNSAVRDYVCDLITRQTSKNGIFGCEINWLQFLAISEIFPLQSVFSKKPVWFFLKRRNLVSQAISNYIADESKVFHSYQLDNGAESAIYNVKYNSVKISSLITQFVAQENMFHKWMAGQRITPIDIFYEDLVSDPDRIIFLMANALRVDIPPLSRERKENPIKKIGTDKNAEFERQFRAERGDFLSATLINRMPILTPAVQV